MNEAIVIQWLQQNWPVWIAFILGLIPALIAEVKDAQRRSGTFTAWRAR